MGAFTTIYELGLVGALVILATEVATNPEEGLDAVLGVPAKS
jgi:hypothetical protein